jgi:hypothetical protein
VVWAVTAFIDMQSARQRAESLMDSTIQFFTAGTPVTDPNTGEVVTPQTVVWSGPCRIRSADYVARQIEVGGAEAFTYDYLISVPWSVTQIIEHLRGTVTSSPDLALAGLTVEVQKVARGSTLSARRLACTVVV